MLAPLFNTLNLIKVFGALLVMACHYAGYYYQFTFYSYGTGCFFIATGYYALNWERSRGIHYLLKRLIRLYPAYLMAVMAYLITRMPALDTWPSLILHHLAFLLTTPDRATVFALNPPFWSLPVFFTFFALIAFIPVFKPRLWQVLGLVFVAFLSVKLSLVAWRESYIELWVLPLHLFAFWWGGLIGHIAHRRPIVPSVLYTWLSVFLMGFIVICGFTFTSIDTLSENASYYFRGFMVLMYGALFWTALQSRLVVRSWRLLSFLGTISFGIYLFHNLPIIWLGPHMTGGAGVILASLLTILLAWGSWRLVELPIQRWCKPRLAKLNRQP